MGITRAELEQECLNIPIEITGEHRRTVYAVLTGNHEDKTLLETISYYNLDKQIAESVAEKYNLFLNSRERVKRGSKKNAIKNYLQNNIGKITSGKELAEELEITLPTFYNFFNNNRAYFKKVSRWKFEILDPESERRREKWK